MPKLSEKLDEIASEFSDLEPRERLEMLLEYAESLPPLPERYEHERNAGEHRVHECQTPVFVWVEVFEGRVKLLAYVAPEAPTVKGFVGILASAYDGATLEDALSTNVDLISRLGLVEALGMQRMRGLQSILHYIRKQIAQAGASAT